jgi:SAM-dependent methyltransferase
MTHPGGAHDPAVQDRIWDYYQNDAADTFAGSHSRLSYLAHQLQPTCKVLDIGVGSGAFEDFASKRGLEVFALDPSDRSIVALQERLGLGDRARVGYSTAIPFPDDFFDAVVVSEVLEHLSDEVLDQSLAEIERVLARGGRLLGTVPARERLADQDVVCPDCGVRFHRWGHRQSFDSARITHLLGARFDVEKVYERRFVTWSTLNWKGRVAAAAQLALHSVGVKGGNTNIVFKARKR